MLESTSALMCPPPLKLAWHSTMANENPIDGAKSGQETWYLSPIVSRTPASFDSSSRESP